MWIGLKKEKYIGSWQAGKAHGFGVQTFTNGDLYEGQFQAYKKHGVGKEYFANGDAYKGGYTQDRADG